MREEEIILNSQIYKAPKGYIGGANSEGCAQSGKIIKWQSLEEIHPSTVEK